MAFTIIYDFDYYENGRFYDLEVAVGDLISSVRSGFFSKRFLFKKGSLILNTFKTQRIAKKTGNLIVYTGDWTRKITGTNVNEVVKEFVKEILDFTD